MMIKYLIVLMLLTIGSAYAGPNASSPIYIDMDTAAMGIQSSSTTHDTAQTFTVAIIACAVTHLAGCEITFKIDTAKYRFVGNAYGSAFNNSMANIWAGDSSSVKFTYARMGMTPADLTADTAKLATVTLKSKTHFGDSASILVLSGQFATSSADYDAFSTINKGVYSVANPLYTVTVSTAAGGSVSPGSVSIISGVESSPIIATADQCHIFKSWEIVSGIGAISITSPTVASTTIFATGSGAIRATYNTLPYTLTVVTDGNGTTAGGGTCGCGAPTPISATGATGYMFANWTVTANATLENSNSASTNVTLTGAATVTAHFTATPYTITVNAQANGTVTPSGATTVNYGDSIRVSATPLAGYGFVNWTLSDGAGNVVVRNANSATTWVVVTGAATIVAKFELIVNTLAVRAQTPKSFSFNVSAGTISYAVPAGKTGRIRIALVDMQGKTVLHHVQNADEAGYYTLSLTGVKKGCYVSCMEANDFNKNLKVVFTK